MTLRYRTNVVSRPPVIISALGCALAVVASPVPAFADEEPKARVVELAICLDTSGSMDGLIESAKQKLWAIVNDLALAEPTPTLRVALLTFGNDGHDPESGWVAVQTPFTGDLDLVSQRLFVLSTNGGTELVGRVLGKAGQLQWHPSDDALKLVVVAGNESADQDQEVPFRDMCKELIGRGIMINSIYCGPESDDIAPAWREIAQLADGQFASIDQDHGMVVIETPFDAELSALSVSLNATYIPMGSAGQEGLVNQQLQDANAAGLNSAASATRATTKAQSLYFCSWDLVDACRAGQIKLEDVQTEELPEAMRKMTEGERAAHLEEMGRQRAEIQQKIVDVTTQRDGFVRAEMQRRALDESDSLDHALRDAIRRQATAKGYRFDGG